MPNRYVSRKLEKKRKRCEINIQNDCNVAVSKEGPTKYIGILNAGLSTGLSEELVLETVEKYGDVRKLLMLPNKSYCFLECNDVNCAISIVQNMHGISKLGQNNSVVYMSFFENIPEERNSAWLNPMPEGLVILNDFVTEKEEIELLNIMKIDQDAVDSNLKHRRVKHFGYEFLYEVNNVNPQQKLDRKIPSECSFLWDRLQKECDCLNLSLDWQEPDQLTVNSYAPGQGIPSHVDTHSAFLDPIISLSLEGDIVMDFRRGLDRRSVLIKRRSLLIMTGESRYDWTHGITPRMMDVVMTTSGNLSTQRRTKRTSLTFRKLRYDGMCNCKYPTLCNSQLKEKSCNNSKHIASDKAALLEEINVHSVYDRIANHFSETRHSQWPRVADFLRSFNESSVLVDVGCGNGKYLNSNPNLLNIGCDRSGGLLKLCNSIGYNVFRCDCLHIPLRSNSVDGCISIAVIHHLATAERRLKAIRELVRILRPTGKGLIYVWAKNQIADNKKSSYLRQNKALNKNKKTELEIKLQTKRDLGDKARESPVDLPVHSNRTTFEQQDVLVPWKCNTPQDQNDEKTTFLRYYHVFEDNELEHLLRGLPDIKVNSTYYDQGNYCCVFEKINLGT